MFEIQNMKPKQLAGLKKTIVYSSEHERDFVEGVLFMHAEQAKKTASATVEDLIEKAVLPTNPTAKNLCKRLYASELNNMTALTHIFDNYASRISFRNKSYQTGKDFIEFLHSSLVTVPYPTNTASKSARFSFESLFDSVCLVIKKYSASENDNTFSENLSKFAYYHLDLARNNPDFFVPVNVTSIIRSNWVLLQEFSYTYETLASLCNVFRDSIIDDLEDRLKLIELIKKASEEWE